MNLMKDNQKGKASVHELTHQPNEKGTDFLFQIASQFSLPSFSSPFYISRISVIHLQ